MIGDATWGMTTSTWGYVIWSLVALSVLGVELVSKDIFGLAPWPSLSYTLKKLIADHPYVALILLYLLITFVIHIFSKIQSWGV